jgi:hypothetical protein
VGRRRLVSLSPPPLELNVFTRGILKCLFNQDTWLAGFWYQNKQRLFSQQQIAEETVCFVVLHHHQCEGVSGSGSGFRVHRVHFPVHSSTCSSGSNGDACRCDVSCAQYGDCCLDSPSFIPEQQQLGASPFTCTDADVYMMSSCPTEWADAAIRVRCEHHDASYRDPLFDVPVTSLRSNITYRNRHCALCHHDLDAGTTNIWPIYFSCDNAWIDLDDQQIIDLLEYNAATSSWILNITEHPELMIFQNHKPVYSCRVGVKPSEEPRTVFRTCDSTMVSVCPEDWADEGVRAQCEAYTSHICHDGAAYRNHYCGICNNNGSFEGSVCLEVGTRKKATQQPPDFTVLLDWHRLRKRDTCQHVSEEYDPFARTCRPVFVQAEGKFQMNSYR